MEEQTEIIDITDEEQVLELSRKHYNLSLEYHNARRIASKYEYAIDVMIASRMAKFREYRNNIGYETARLMLLEEEGELKEEIHESYKAFKIYSSKYKGLEEVLKSIQGQISLIQSLTRNRREMGA